MTPGSTQPPAGAGIEDDQCPWGGPAVRLRASGADAVAQALEADSDPYGQLRGLAGLDEACRTIAQAVKVERVAIVRQMASERGVSSTAAMLELDRSTVRHMAPSGRTQRASTSKGRERQAVRLYAEGHSVDGVAKRMGMGHRRVTRVLQEAGVELRETRPSTARKVGNDG